MIPEVIKQWEERKLILEEFFKNNNQSEYSSYLSIVKKIIELVIIEANEYSSYSPDKITVIDDGDYQGTQIFIIPSNTYQPCIEDYLVTHTYYGSCSGCDTLQGIIDWGYERPSESQVKEYMTLALHLVQKMKKLG